MIFIIHYISAKRRLEEADKTFRMLDGDVSPMMLAQRDMIKFEVEYYREKMEDFILVSFILGGIVLICYVIFELLVRMGVL